MSISSFSYPGVYIQTDNSLPRASNLSTDHEAFCGTSKRDYLARAYPYIRKLVITQQFTQLRSFIEAMVQRILNEKLQRSRKQFLHLTSSQRLELAIIEQVISPGTGTLISSMHFTSDPVSLLHKFITLLRDEEVSNLYYEPFISLMLKDSAIFPEDYEIYKLNNESVRII